MKQNLFLIITLAFVFTACVRTDKAYFDNGKLKSEIKYKGDLLHGTSIWYYESGKKQLEFNYQNGNMEGPSRRWFLNGQLESEEFYVRNQKQGPETHFLENGIRVSKAHFFENQLHGPYFEWFDNGVVRIEGSYNHGLFDSTWNYYNFRGILIGNAKFENGNGTHQVWSLDGKLLRETLYQNNLKHGPEMVFDKNGSVVKTYIYEHGELIPTPGATDKKLDR
ncbi:MAG: toxin-antitoxin system YwqK family antitoxin [Bacteroidales bacterium]|nr:toxin-antitoxin system YwqK family antitoxin [Bacteroidales bacterium]